MKSRIRITSFLRRREREPDREAGQALVLVAAALVALVGFVGMAVDVGLLVYTRTDLQKAADAAALAAAQDLDGTSAGAAAAIATADSYLQQNGAGSASCRPSCATVAAPFDTISVTANRSVQYTFLRVLGMTGATPSAQAAAQMTRGAVTGYQWDSLAPFVIWGGSRQSEVHAGDQSCPLHTCPNRSYTFLDNQWMEASGNPSGPDWTASDSNNFKGDINHGDGAPVIQVGESFQTSSNGGLGSVTAPAVGTTIVVPVINRATGNSNLRTFTIAAWAVVRVDAGCKKQGCTGTVLSTETTPPAGWVTGGTTQPPPSLTYQAPALARLVQ